MSLVGESGDQAGAPEPGEEALLVFAGQFVLPQSQNAPALGA